MNFDSCMSICLVIGLLIGISMILKTKQKKYLQAEENNKPDDLFEDGLDHPYGIKKKNRHHIN